MHEHRRRPRFLSPVLSLFFLIGVVILAFGSMMTFPAHIPWMAAGWGMISLLALAKRRPMWPWLIGLLVIMTIKRPGLTAEYWILCFTLLALALWDWWTLHQKTHAKHVLRLLICGLMLASATMTFGMLRWNASNQSKPIQLDQRPIACLGDSLTASGYPEELQKRVTVPVVNFGVPGINTDTGIKMIPQILAADPQLVIIELGGHDYNADKKTRKETLENMRVLIEAFRQRNIAVILIEIPRGFIYDPYAGLERELAAEYDLQLVDDSIIRSFVFNSPILPPGMWLAPTGHYSDDGLHPNAQGNRQFAKVISRALVKVFGGSVLH